MSLHFSDTRERARAPWSLWANERWHGTLVGLIPLESLIGITVVTLLIVALVRQLITEFALQQQTNLIILGVGFALAIVTYTIAVFLTLRRAAAWEKDGLEAREHAALWTLGVTTLIILLPLVVLVILPQRPAP
jgi:hypothetical protein